MKKADFGSKYSCEEPLPKEAEVASNICENVINFSNNLHLLQMI